MALAPSSSHAGELAEAWVGHTRYGRLAGMSAAGLLVAGAVAVVTSQTGLNVSAGGLVAVAEVRGLSAASTAIQAAPAGRHRQGTLTPTRRLRGDTGCPGRG